MTRITIATIAALAIATGVVLHSVGTKVTPPSFDDLSTIIPPLPVVQMTNNVKSQFTKVICSSDITLPLSLWTQIIGQTERTNGETNYVVPAPDGPIRFYTVLPAP